MLPSVYLDNGATTRVHPDVAALALEVMTTAYGNPSSLHRLGTEAARILDRARGQVAAAIGARPGEVTFTSGGTEANNLAVLGVAAASRGRHIVVSAVEHSSVVESVRHLEAEGFELSVVSVDSSGLVDPDQLAEAVRPDTALVALLWVQNEVGTLQPLGRLAGAVRARAPRCHLHADGVQALGKLLVDVRELGVDSLSLSAHKIHGPKGVGALWLRPGARVRPRLFGGGQERGLRPGTEALPLIAAMGLATELAEAARPEAAARMGRLRDQLAAGILETVPGAVRHVPIHASAPHIVSLGFPGVRAEPLLHALEARGVIVSSGSACHSKDRRPSPVLRALGIADSLGTIRFSLSRETTDEEIAQAVAALPPAISEVRA